MPAEIIYPKALYNFTAVVTPNNFLNILYEYVENYNTIQDTYDSRVQISNFYNINNLSSTIQLDIENGTAIYFEIGNGNSMFKIGSNEYGWYQGEGMVDPAYIYSIISQAGVF